MTGLQGFFLPLPRHADRAPLRDRGAVDHRHHPARSPALSSASPTSTATIPARRRSGRLAEALYRRVDWAWIRPRAAAGLHGLDPGKRFPYLRLARPQRGDDPLRARPRLADAPDRPRGLAGMDPHLSMGDVLRPGARQLRPAVRPPVLAGLDRLPGHPRRLHARQAGSTTSRTRAAPPSPSAPTPIANPGGFRGYGENVWGLTACDGPLRRRARRSTAERSAS